MIALIFVGDLKYCPYLNNYTDLLDENNTEYEVLYWQRDTTSKEYPSNYIPFKFESKLNEPLYKKLNGFLKFRKWVKKIIEQKKYSKLILLSTLSGMIIPDVLKKYSGKYIFDIRDYSYESYSFYKKVESKIIENSFFTSISSPMYQEFLPKSDKYVVNHNINLSVVQKEKFTKENKDVINFVWAGTIRYYEHQKMIIDHLLNDPRFNIIFHGIGPDYNSLKEYSRNTSINNIIFTGEYNDSDKIEIYTDADILNNSYDNKNNTLNTKYAISNKFYDGIVYKIPQLVETDTYKQTLVEEYGIGIALDINDERFADKLFEYHSNINSELFNKNATLLYSKFKSEQENYYTEISNFISS